MIGESYNRYNTKF